MINDYIDLHIHSCFSDGELNLLELLQLSNKSNLKAIAITDHFNIDVHKENIKKNIEIIPGIEITTEFQNQRIHLIGLMFDPYFEDLNNKLKIIHIKRLKYVKKLKKDLENEGVFLKDNIINLKSLIEELSKQYPFKEKKQIKIELSRFKNYEEYRRASIIDIKEFIDLMHKSGGFVIVPHVDRLQGDLKSMLNDLKDLGIDGIETIYPTYTEKLKKFLNDYCEINQLLKSGGSDFHGNKRNSNIIGCPRIPYCLLQDMKNIKYKNDN